MAWESGLVERLKKGETVQFRPHGNSMVPIIKSGQLVTVAPLQVFGDEAGREVDGVQRCVQKGDAVFWMARRRASSTSSAPMRVPAVFSRRNMFITFASDHW